MMTKNYPGFQRHQKKIVYPDFNEYIDIVSAIMDIKKYESRSEYEKDHTLLSIKVLEKMLQKNYITDEQKKEYETTIKLLKETINAEETIIKDALEQ
jgi:hypothetical protein